MLKLISKIDWILIIPVLLLSLIGIFMIYSSSISGEEQLNFFIRQSAYVVIGIGLFFLVFAIGFKFILSYSLWLYALTILLLVVTFILGLESRGSTRWIDFGVINLQASEVAKPVLILFLTSFFASHPPKSFKNIFISFLIAIVPTYMVFQQPDLGSAIVLFAIWIGLIYIAGIKLFHISVLGLIGLVSLPIGYSLLRGYQRQRLLTFLNPENDPLGTGYNVVQSIIAVGSGQMFGKGFGRGTQSHLNFLPEQKTDFIFATTAEELGFIGVFVIFCLFLVILVRLVQIANSSRTKEGSLIVYGVAFVIAVQLLINAGMNMGIVPIAGITLPFVSFGGSSMISMFILLGLVQSVKLANK